MCPIGDLDRPGVKIRRKTIPYGTVSALAEGWRPSSGYRCRLRAGSMANRVIGAF